MRRSNPIPGEYGPTGAGRFAARTGAWFMARMLSLLHWARRVRRPLAPRSGIQPRAFHTRVLEREQVVAGGDARSAVADDVVGRRVAQGVLQPRAQFFGRAEQSALVEVPLEEIVGGARNVAGGLVDRFSFAAVALGCARVNELPLRGRQLRCDGSGVDRHV